MRRLSELNDEELMEMLGQNKIRSEAAFTEIYARYSKKIYVYCQRIMEFEDDANDIFQDTFVRFYEHYKNNRNVTNILGMLFRISRNLCLNFKRDIKDTVEFDEMKMPFYDNTAENDELVELISKAVKFLDFELREVFILRNYEGMSYQEITEILDLSMPTVRNRLLRAKEKLKEILQPYLAELE